MPGAGDESVLDGMPERMVEGEAAEAASETREVEIAVSAESLEAWAPEFAVGATSPAEPAQAQEENVAAAEEAFAIEEQYSEPTPALQTPAQQAADILVESDAEPNSVVQVFQKGYLLNDRVLRPALVAVAKARDEGPAAET